MTARDYQAMQQQARQQTLHIRGLTEQQRLAGLVHKRRQQ